MCKHPLFVIDNVSYGSQSRKMAGCVDSDVEYEIHTEETLISERESLLRQNANIQMRRTSNTAMESSQSSPQHMLSVLRDEEDSGDGHFTASGMVLPQEPSVQTHCHGPAASEDPVARNQLIAISVLCFVFMIAEVVGQFCFKITLVLGVF